MMSVSISVDDVIIEATRDPVSYYHGETCRAILTAWDGTNMDMGKLERAQIFLGKLIQLLTTPEVTDDAVA